MNASDVARIVNAEIEGFRYELPAAGTTVGVPWPVDKVLSFLPKLRAALVNPHQRRFVLRDTSAQIEAASPTFADYWVVAETDGYIEFFDPSTSEYGLAVPPTSGDVPITIGVRGDLVGVFCAM